MCWFGCNNINLEEIINAEISKFKPDISSLLEAEISEKEVSEFLKNMKKNNSPDSYGLKVEFLK